MEHRSSEVIATISASAPRRWLGVASIAGLGLLLFYVAFSTPPALGWQVFLLVLGAAALWLADRMRQATSRVLELTEEGLYDDTGTVIVRVEDIARVERGAFAFKPSNGFLIRTRAATGPRAWQPGLWWRMGRQIGIGGVTPGSQAKFVAEYLQTLIAQRDGTRD